MATLCAIMTIDPRTALDAIGQLDDDEIDILDAALRLGLVDGHHNEIRKLAVHASELARNAVGLEDDRTAAGRAAALAKLLAGRHRYQGDAETYDDLANANLPTVIARRKGLPVALGTAGLLLLAITAFARIATAEEPDAAPHPDRR